MKRREWAGEEVTGNQVIGLSGNQGKGEKGKRRNGNTGKITDTPIPRYPDTPTRYKGGFTLLEVLFAIAILAFGLLSIMQIFPVGLKASKISQDVTTATFLAQQKIEELKSIKYSDIGNGSGTFEEPYSEFDWEQKVSEEISGWLKNLTVRVSWDRYGKTRNVKLTTLLTDYQKKFQ